MDLLSGIDDDVMLTNSSPVSFIHDDGQVDVTHGGSDDSVVTNRFNSAAITHDLQTKIKHFLLLHKD